MSESIWAALRAQCQARWSHWAAERDLNPRRKRREKPINDNDNIAKTGAVDAPSDPELARIVVAWPSLAEPIRLAMLAIVDAFALK